MDFFERQARSRRTSRFLVAAFAVAFAAVVVATTALAAFVIRIYSFGEAPFVSAGVADWALANAGLLGSIAAGTLLLMVLASFYRAASLAGGGGKVARLLGGTEVSGDAGDLPRKRLINVVEEMAIASGLPMPDVYVLEEEAGINAFAAGTTPSNAAIAVTRGALERLERAELQGVIAHELSHIAHGDVRLNQQLIGFSFGILVLSLIGRWLMRGAYVARRARSRGKGSAAVLIGLGFVVIGSIGVLLTRLIKAAVSRERERLADASAVQFTRDTQGLASALMKIGGYTATLKSIETEEVSHMLFERGAPSFRGWFATHPPLEERIRALDPSFDTDSLTRPDGGMRRAGGKLSSASPLAADPEAVADAAGAIAAAAPGNLAAAAPGNLAAAAPGSLAAAAPASLAAAASGSLAAAPPLMAHSNAGDEHGDALLARTGQLGSPELGARLREALPPEVYDAAHSRDSSLLLVLALTLSLDEQKRAAQRALLDAQLGSRRAARCEMLRAHIEHIDAALRMPVLGLALPALKKRPSEQLEYVFELAEKLTEAGGKPTLFNYVLRRMLAAHLAELPGRGLSVPPKSKLSARAACSTLLAVVAAYGHRDVETARAAYLAGLGTIRGKLPDLGARIAAMRELTHLDAALARLVRIGPRAKKQVLEALLATIRHDRRIGTEERELFRAIAATLGCPVPWSGALPEPATPPSATRSVAATPSGAHGNPRVPPDPDPPGRPDARDPLAAPDTHDAPETCDPLAAPDTRDASETCDPLDPAATPSRTQTC